MTPPPIRLPNLDTHEPLGSTPAAPANAMYLRHILTVETTSGGSSGGVQQNTIIFIVVGVVCLLVLLIGFYLVSRPRVPSNVATSVPNPHSPTASDSHPQGPRSRLDTSRSKSWKIWKIWLRSSHPTTPEPPTSQVSPTPVTTITPSPIPPARTGSKDSHPHRPPPIVSRPRQTRRVTSPSIQTDFSHSHITQDALQNYHACSYDLDEDLVIEMLHSACDEVGPSYPVEWDSEHGSVREPVVLEEPGGIATPDLEGGVVADQFEGGGHESLGASSAVRFIGPLTAEPVAEPFADMEAERVEVEDTEKGELRHPVGILGGIS